MRPSLYLSLALAAVCSCTQPSRPPAVTVPVATAKSAPAPLVMGETFQFDSKVLSERRVINVYLPPGYAEGSTHYPVLYMPDGGMKEDFPHITGIIDVSIKNEVIRPVIVVGVENTERRRDLIGPSTVPKDLAIAPHAGGADRFREFLRTELKPHIAAHYRVTAESALVGESFAGLFVLETLIVDPELFDSYIAVSPSVWWNDQALVRGAPARFAAWSAKPKRLFVATADEQEPGVPPLLEAMRTLAPGRLDVHYLPLPDEHHSTIFPVAALRAFRTLFAFVN